MTTYANVLTIAIPIFFFLVLVEILYGFVSKKTKALMVVHQFGHAAHMKEIIDICRKYDVKIIEDNAESIGGYYKNKILGSMGDVSTLSFYGNKIITTGEGGALLTNSKQIYQKCKIIKKSYVSIDKCMKFYLSSLIYLLQLRLYVHDRRPAHQCSREWCFEFASSKSSLIVDCLLMPR